MEQIISCTYFLEGVESATCESHGNNYENDATVRKQA